MSREVAAEIQNAAWLEDPATQAVMRALAAGGGEARFVGGVVRDSLLGLPVKDIDIATPLPPQAVIERLKAAGLKAIPTGIDHGTVTAVADHKPFEITTLRRDVETDGRRALVAFTDDWREDAARRDFTMNALYLDVQGRLTDYFGGAEDARAGHIRFIGDPLERIAEDALRILRFFRFHAGYGRGAPDRAGLEACAERRLSLKGLSRERIRDELLKLLSAPDPRATVRVMLMRGILEGVLPEIADYDHFARLVEIEQQHGYGRGRALRRLVSLLPQDPAVVEDIARRLRLSNKDIRAAMAMIGPATENDVMTPQAARAGLYRLGAEGFIDRLFLTADAPGADIDKALAIASGWQKPRFPISGGELIDRKLAEGGPQVSQLLRKLEDAWIASDFTLSKEELLARA